MKAFAAYYNESNRRIQFKKIEQEIALLGERDLLVKIEAISINPIDYKVANSLMGKPLESKVLGWDAAGTIIDVGEKTQIFKKGDNVYYAGAIDRPGTNSEFHLVDERIVGYMPNNLSFKDAAALPLTAITAYEALFERLQIPKIKKEGKSKSVLLIGAAGGVGSIAIQLLKQLTSTVVIATASRSESGDWVKSLGVDFVINHKDDFVTQLQKIGLKEVDYIFCINGLAMHFAQMAKAIKPFGKICSIVDPEQPIDIALLKSKSVAFIWELMFTRSLYQTEDMIQQHHLLNEVANLIENKQIKTTVGLDLGTMDENVLQQAHEILMNRQAVGKVVLGCGHL